MSGHQLGAMSQATGGLKLGLGLGQTSGEREEKGRLVYFSLFEWVISTPLLP